MRGSHLRTMIWLRWHLTRNQWRRVGALNAAIMFVLVYAAIVAGAIGGIAGVAGGFFGLSQARPEVTMGVFDFLIAFFLVLWTLGVVTELQRSEVLDVGRFLHLPVALRDVFVINYLASLVCISMVVFLPTMAGLAFGLLLGRGPAMLLLFPLIIGFFFMITAWTYCFRGWLAALMVNKRRRQAIIMGITLTFILLSQTPNLVFNVWLRPGHRNPAKTEQEIEERARQIAENEEKIEAVFAAVHRAVPPLWLSYGAGELADGRIWPALLGAAGMMGIGAWGFQRAYRGTIRFYQGCENGKVRQASTAVKTPASGRRALVERALPFVPESVSALAMATLRSMSRAPEVKMAIVSNALIVGIVVSGAFLRRGGTPPAEIRPFIASGAVAACFMGLIQLMSNHFGFDRSGFRALVLLPTPRRHILLGKNIAASIIALVMFSLFLVLTTAMAHLQFLDVVTAVIEFVAVCLLMSVLGNLGSILVPYRMGGGSMKRTKMSGTTALLVFVSHLVSMIAVLPAVLPPLAGMLIGFLLPIPVAAVTLACAVMTAVFAAILYWQTLDPLGRLLERRQFKILEMVTQEVE